MFGRGDERGGPAVTGGTDLDPGGVLSAEHPHQIGRGRVVVPVLETGVHEQTQIGAGDIRVAQRLETGPGRHLRRGVVL